MSDDLDEVLRAFERLVAEHEVQTADTPEEDTNFRCVDCSECSACRFCTACERCVDCTYCDACTDCEGCTQCRECLGCAGCSHSNHTAYCEKSSYLTLCIDCEGCVQCFACVGLTSEEFCVLNQRYTRRAYFNKVNELRAALDARTLEGWFPPWMRDAVAERQSVEAPVEPAEPVRVQAVRIESADAPTVRPEPLTDIAAAERTGSWPPVDHASARAFDRGGISPWDGLDDDAAFEAPSVEPDTVRRRVPEPRGGGARFEESRLVRDADPHRQELGAREAERERERAEAAERERERGEAAARERERAEAEERERAVVAERERADAAERERERAETAAAERERERVEAVAERDRAEAGVPSRAGPREYGTGPIRPPRVDDRAQGATASRFGAQQPERARPEAAARLGGERRRDRFEAQGSSSGAPMSLLEEQDDGGVFDKPSPRALIDELPRAGRRQAPEPAAPRHVDLEPTPSGEPRREPDADGRLTRGQRPSRPTDVAQNSLRTARRPRRPDR